MGFYPLQPRDDPEDSSHRFLDFSGTDRRVIVTEDEELADDFSCWFDFIWNAADG